MSPSIKIKTWLEKKGWSLLFEDLPGGEVGILCWENKNITITNLISKEEQKYALLHECGHLLVLQNEKSYQEMFPIQHKATLQKKHKKRNMKYKIEIIQEEMLAWERGKKLAKRLGISINKKNWDKFKNYCLFTYIEWAAKK